MRNPEIIADPHQSIMVLPDPTKTATTVANAVDENRRFEDWKAKLTSNLELGRIPLIVMGSGVSAGAGVPVMKDIHNYLQEKLASEDQTDTTKIARQLLTVLQEQKESPRSVQVRLYHLLQETPESQIRRLWKTFGRELLDGKITEDKPQKLWQIDPSATHKWAAELALNRRAVVVSLNYDGLTARAVNLDSPHAARILSSAEDIRHYYAGHRSSFEEESEDDSVAVVKFRGDVFHAVCDNGRCPEIARSAPLYDLIRTGRVASKTPNTAESLLECPSCGSPRDLRISFPGVFGKEQEIDRALAAFHEIMGCNLAAIVFLGFSGAWDERLVAYLVGRAGQLDLPIISLSQSPTPAIDLHAQSIGSNYLWRHCVLSEPLHPDLKQLLPTEVKLSVCEPQNDHAFVGESFAHQASMEVVTRKRTITVSRRDKSDTFTGIGSDALELPEIRRLTDCSQLGPKSAFLREPDLSEHSRYRHSAGAILLSMIWFERMLDLKPKTSKAWWWSKDARLALEMAVLFHDARHLPFSHMMEDVFSELNWGVIPNKSWDIRQYVQSVRPDLTNDTEFKRKLTARISENGVRCDTEVWWTLRVEALQECKSGAPWIDAIVDSALDADKIDYIFRDTKLTGQSVRLRDQVSWFTAFLTDQRLTPEGLIRLEGQSCFAALELLEERLHLYRKLYLEPELRALEALARYIVTTWLEWKVPERITISQWTTYESGSDLRTQKAKIAGDLLWELYNDRKQAEPKGTEIAVLKSMIDELKALNALDPAAETWLTELWRHLEPFSKAPEGGRATLADAQDTFATLAPIGPLYVHRTDYDSVRRIIRTWRVHYPLVALIDVVKFPKFLATPNVRSVNHLGLTPAHAEQFLVPSTRPSEWRTRSAATVPLHQCDFSGFELPVAQMLILDPLGSASAGSSFVHQMLLREFREQGISVFESPEEAAKMK